MGVPKFYRWISERYPKINQIISDQALLPEVQHCYLDLNGVIHGATHPPSLDISEVLSERDMMLGIVNYIDRIIGIIKPKVSVYMAIDGVAPRAKLNQQRSRRFRSAKDMEDKQLPEGTEVFDSNCITPGTEFLEKVSAVIQYFIRKKLKEDWHNLTVIFSGHDVPGEGEHKIMQHIRELRASPNYPSNSTHCIYGQDADLIMLGLVTHEPHFCILREVIDFNFNFSSGQKTLKAVKKFTKESNFQLLHLSVLREYLSIEFCRDGDGAYDLERVVDDFVFMTFLVGNDFLPHMPTLDIGDGAFDLLFNIYRDQRAHWNGGYLTQSGEIADASRLEAFLAAIGAVESEILEQREKDEAAYMKKRRRWDKRDGKPEGPSDAQLKHEEAARQSEYLGMMEAVLATPRETSDFVAGWRPVAEAGQKDFKGRYYFEKLQLTPVDKEKHWELRKSYMEGLMWCLAYYYKGCISWGWFYPYHYGPMLSDLIDIPRMFREISFDEGEPLRPFQQLMGCLPPASSALVPKLYRWLMTSPESPIIQFYPREFRVDMNGKKNPWEGVNLLPFIDVQLLKDTIAKHCPSSKLSAAENRRNEFGKVFCYRYDVSCNDTISSPNRKIGLPDIVGSNTSMVVIETQHTTGTPFKPILLPGTQIPYPGFPSLNVLPFASVELTRIGLNVFGTPSKYPTTVLYLHQMPELPPLEVLAQAVLGKSLFINWPMMHEGRVVSISNEEKEIRLVKGSAVTKKYKDIDADRWKAESESMVQMYHIGNGVPGSGGVVIGDVKIRLRLNPLQGMKTNPANGSTKKVFGREEADVPLQLALWEAPAPDPRFIERRPMTLVDRFPENCSVVLTKGKYRGCKGTVVGIADQKHVGVKVQIFPAELPFGLAIARSVQETYLSSADAARILKMPAGLFGKLTGKLQFEQGKYDLGLNLKSADGTCVVGYTRRKLEKPHQGSHGKSKKPSVWDAGDSVLVVGSDRMTKANEEFEERIQWEYSPKAIRLVEAYRQKFPQLFTEIKKNPNEKKYDANKVFGPNGEAWLPVIREWLDKHESAKLPRSPVTSESMSYDAVAAVQKAADVRSLALKKRGFPKESLVKVPGNALYREGSTGATDLLLASDLNNNEPPELGDRIVNLCADGVPFAARGTVVGVHEAATTGSVEVVMDEEFIGGTSLQGACSNFRGKLCLWSHLLKIAPDNSKALVDRMVPKASGRAAVDRIISNIEREVKNDKTHQVQSSWDATVDAGAPQSRDMTPTVIQPDRQSVTNNFSAPATIRTTDASNPAAQALKVVDTGLAPSASLGASAPRTPSTGRSGRQGAWREAKGPDKNGNGFKGGRNRESGMMRWKAHLAKLEQETKSKESSRELKAILGVKLHDDAPNVNVQAAKPVSTTEGAAQLKTLLGVGPSEGLSAGSREPLDAAADLKAILGVGTAISQAAPPFPPPPPPPPPPPRLPATAADKLLQLIASKQHSPPSYPVNVQPRSMFNFTYVEEGNEADPTQRLNYAAPPPQPHPGFFHPFPFATNPQHPPMPMMQFAAPPPQNLSVQPHPVASTSPPAGMRGAAGNHRGRASGKSPRDTAALTLSIDQFPPLNALPVPSEANQEPEVIQESPAPTKLLKPERTLMVPSVVAGSARR